MRWANTMSRSLRGAAFALWLGGGTALAADELLWFEGGRPGPQAGQAVELLSAAASHGLEPGDYDAAALRQALTRAAVDAAPDPAASERLDQALTAAMQRYLTDLHQGRIDPRADPSRLPPAAPRRLRRCGHAAHRAGGAAPARGGARGRAAHAAVRAPARGAGALPRAGRSPGLATAAAALAGRPRSSGRQARAGPGLCRRGAAGAAAGRSRRPRGRRSATAPRCATKAHLVDAVRAFQQRHGLAADGVIGKATLAQLQVSPAARVRQIELMLERLRWTPLMQGPRMVVINIPEFVLRAYEVVDGRIVVREQMKVIVGKALDTRTPLFDEDMRFIEFSPYWNVPPSIARGETGAAAAARPGLLRARGLRVRGRGRRCGCDAVSGEAGCGARRPAAHPPAARAAATRSATSSSCFRTATTSTCTTRRRSRLFERERRDFSHGCIRVEQPGGAGEVRAAGHARVDRRAHSPGHGAGPHRPRCGWPSRCRC